MPDLSGWESCIYTSFKACQTSHRRRLQIPAQRISSFFSACAKDSTRSPWVLLKISELHRLRFFAPNVSRPGEARDLWAKPSQPSLHSLFMPQQISPRSMLPKANTESSTELFLGCPAVMFSDWTYFVSQWLLIGTLKVLSDWCLSELVDLHLEIFQVASKVCTSSSCPLQTLLQLFRFCTPFIAWDFCLSFESSLLALCH